MKNIRKMYLIICGLSVVLLLGILLGFSRNVNSVYEPENSVKKVDYTVSLEDSGVSLTGVIDTSDVRDRYLGRGAPQHHHSHRAPARGEV